MSEEVSELDSDKIIRKNIRTEETNENSSQFSKYLDQINDFNSGILKMINCPSISSEPQEGDSFYFSMNCNPELSLLPFLMVQHGYPNDEEDDCNIRPAYNQNIVGPRSCEYCNATSTQQCCPDTCERPKYFFLKKRGPFQAKNDKWDPETDYEINALSKVESFDPLKSAKNDYKIEELRSIFTKQTSAKATKAQRRQQQSESVSNGDGISASTTNKTSQKDETSWMDNLTRFASINALRNNPD